MWTPLSGAGATVGVVALTAALLAPASPPRGHAGSLVGQLLVAMPELDDPNFAHTVVYMLRHDADGAMGLVVNRPLGDIPLATLLEETGGASAGATGTVRLHAGGPVEPAQLFVLHTDDYTAVGTLHVGPGLALTRQPDILRALAARAGPRRAVFALGYAGWGPGQLEGELSAGAWVSAASDEGILFDGADDTKWDRAFARRRISL
jgi:putative transcriptional regulator